MWILQDCNGLLRAEQVCETCFQYNLPLTADQLSLLVAWCSEGESTGIEGGVGERTEGRVRYQDLLELVNWQRELSTELEEKMKQKNCAGVQPTRSFMLCTWVGHFAVLYLYMYIGIITGHWYNYRGWKVSLYILGSSLWIPVFIWGETGRGWSSTWPHPPHIWSTNHTQWPPSTSYQASGGYQGINVNMLCNIHTQLTSILTELRWWKWCLWPHVSLSLLKQVHCKYTTTHEYTVVCVYLHYIRKHGSPISLDSRLWCCSFFLSLEAWESGYSPPESSTPLVVLPARLSWGKERVWLPITTITYKKCYSSRGVFERDFFQCRAPEEVRGVFQKVGVEMPDQVFQDVWQEAERRDPRREVNTTYTLYISIA